MEKEEQSQEDQARISELEQEVQRLKAKVEPEPMEDDGNPITEADMPYMPPRWRAIVIPIVIGVAVFVAIIAVTSALSSGFDSFAKKAAATLVPEDLAEQAGRGGTPAVHQRPAVKLAPMKPGKAEPPVRAPGL
jgi:hypothetical protein